MKKLVFFIIVMISVCFSLAFADNSWSEGADINGDGIVDYKDFAILAQYWLATDPNAPPDITWVDVEDPGIGGGNEGFTGYMSKYETTNAEYCRFLNQALFNNDIAVVTIGNNLFVKGTSGTYSEYVYYRLNGPGFTWDGATDGGKSRITYSGGQFAVDSGFENHPVTWVSWYGATAFASYYGWRLPTQAEWQAVADYDGSYIYGCGVSINNSVANYAGSLHPHGTTTVGSFGLYGYGMADMAGNVAEWTNSVWGGSYYILCGGAWYTHPDGTTVSSVIKNWPDTMGYYIGFRICH
jgi:formylglycine-generating enzyme required for sulfatase activity